MITRIKNIVKLTLLLFIAVSVHAQTNNNVDGVSIDPNNSPPHPASILDVQGTDKGVLIPRMSQTQMNLVAPLAGADGLEVFVNDNKRGLWYYDESENKWVRYGIDIDILIPPTMVVPFNLADGCPTGWKELNIMKGKFIVGAGTLDGNSYSLGSSGGQSKVSLQKEEIPKHIHNYDVPVQGLSTKQVNHKHDVEARSKGTKVGKHRNTGYKRGNNDSEAHTQEGRGYDDHPHNMSDPFSNGSPVVNSNHSHSLTGNADVVDAGGVGLSGSGHENRPPYISFIYCTRDF